MISVGTGGSISGVGRYFKERKPEVLIVGAGPVGLLLAFERRAANAGPVPSAPGPAVYTPAAPAAPSPGADSGAGAP